MAKKDKKKKEGERNQNKITKQKCSRRSGSCDKYLYISGRGALIA